MTNNLNQRAFLEKMQSFANDVAGRYQREEKEKQRKLHELLRTTGINVIEEVDPSWKGGRSKATGKWVEEYGHNDLPFHFALYGGADGVIVAYEVTIDEEVYTQRKRIALESVKNYLNRTTQPDLEQAYEILDNARRPLPVDAGKSWLEEPNKARNLEYLANMALRIERTCGQEAEVFLKEKYGVETEAVSRARYIPNYVVTRPTEGLLHEEGEVRGTRLSVEVKYVLKGTDGAAAFRRDDEFMARLQEAVKEEP